MASFKDKVKGKKVVGNKIINSDQALGLVFKKDENTKVVDIKLSALIDNPHQPRVKMKDEEINELAGSIMHNGLLQPILVSQVPGKRDQFYIVAGHRRVAAVRHLEEDNKDATIKAILLKDQNEEALKTNALIENIHRSDLTILEEAMALKKLADILPQQNDLCDIVFYTEDKISKLIKLTDISEDAFNYINENRLNIGMTILLEVIKLDKDKHLEAIKYIEENRLKRKEVQEYVKNIKRLAPMHVKKRKPKSFQFKQKDDQISFKLNINEMEEKEKLEAINRLEELLKELKDSE